MDLSQLTVDIMLPHLGSVFRTELAGGRALDLTLVDVAKGGDRHVSPASGRAPFSLIFAGPPEPYLPQAAYPMRHEILDDGSLVFIVPIARDADGYRYEAVFS